MILKKNGKTLILTKRCKKCTKIIAHWNKSGYCSNCSNGRYAIKLKNAKSKQT